jgi:hypothetical protein
VVAAPRGMADATTVTEAGRASATAAVTAA